MLHMLGAAAEFERELIKVLGHISELAGRVRADGTESPESIRELVTSGYLLAIKVVPILIVFCTDADKYWLLCSRRPPM
jgi:hypothetical protein